METPEVEAHAPHHKTGISWLDASLSLSAFAVSIISLFVAIHHGHTMQEMAEANARMVAASSWPFVEYRTGNLAQDGSQVISCDLANQGVGPARIEKLQFLYLGKPMKSTLDLLNACCIRKPTDLETIMSGTDFKSHIVTTPVEGHILAAHDQIVILALGRTKENAAIWDRLNVERSKMQAQVCYCSVFDECWTNGRTGGKPNRLDHCPADWISYTE